MLNDGDDLKNKTSFCELRWLYLFPNPSVEVGFL